MSRADRATRGEPEEAASRRAPATAESAQSAAAARGPVLAVRTADASAQGASAHEGHSPQARGTGNQPAPVADTPVADASSPDSKTRRGPPRKTVLFGALLFAAITAAWLGLRYVTVGRYMVTTDDAYVRADVTNIAAKVGGYILQFEVKENAFVRAGDIIATIDDGDYKIARDAAVGKAETQRATLLRIDSQIAAQDSLIGQGQAGLAAAEADARRALLDYQRYADLARTNYGTKQRLEQAEADRNRTMALVLSAKAQLANAQAGKDVLKAQRLEAERTLAELQTQIEKAERDLSFTKVRAPVDGQFGNKSVQAGAWVNPGSRVGALVALDSLYVEANFKETQIERMRAGQLVAITVDALPGETLTGTLESFSPGSGGIFSLLPPENATGNFTKIVQRVPIRVALPRDVMALALLRPGLSVTAKVDTRGAGAPAPVGGSVPGPVATSKGR